MKLAVLILLFALGAMWYRGDIGFGHRPEEFGLPPQSKIPSITATLAPDLQEADKPKTNAPGHTRQWELLTGPDAAMLSSKDRDAYDKWLTERQRKRTVSDKLLNFFSHGKYE